MLYKVKDECNRPHAGEVGEEYTFSVVDVIYLRFRDGDHCGYTSDQVEPYNMDCLIKHNHHKSDKHQMHQDLCNKMHEIYVEKNIDYGDSFGKTFDELGILSAVTRMSDKFNRIKALAVGTQRKVKDESLEDTLIDLANYCLMTVIELKK